MIWTARKKILRPRRKYWTYKELKDVGRRFLLITWKSRFFLRFFFTDEKRYEISYEKKKKKLGGKIFLPIDNRTRGNGVMLSDPFLVCISAECSDWLQLLLTSLVFTKHASMRSVCNVQCALRKSAVSSRFFLTIFTFWFSIHHSFNAQFEKKNCFFMHLLLEWINCSWSTGRRKRQVKKQGKYRWIFLTACCKGVWPGGAKGPWPPGF